MPDKSDARDPRRSVELDRHSGHHVREPATFPRLATEFGRGHCLKHPGGSLGTSCSRRNPVQVGRPQPSAEGDLQSHRIGDSIGPFAGRDGRLGPQECAGITGTLDPCANPGRRRGPDVASLHGGASCDSSGRTAPRAFHTRETSEGVRGRDAADRSNSDMTSSRHPAGNLTRSAAASARRKSRNWRRRSARRPGR
jgi:hypothetical protein